MLPGMLPDNLFICASKFIRAVNFRSPSGSAPVSWFSCNRSVSKDANDLILSGSFPDNWLSWQRRNANGLTPWSWQHESLKDGWENPFLTCKTHAAIYKTPLPGPSEVGWSRNHGSRMWTWVPLWNLNKHLGGGGAFDQDHLWGKTMSLVGCAQAMMFPKAMPRLCSGAERLLELISDFHPTLGPRSPNDPCSRPKFPKADRGRGSVLSCLTDCRPSGILPRKRFSDIFMHQICGRVQAVEGNAPENVFECKSSKYNIARHPKLAGKVPLNLIHQQTCRFCPHSWQVTL